ncbi:alpha/beta fold hydrolase [Actinoplanes sp. N902-109]|uniref:alpha/beta fold hydrolase n=1 Tax=Actinoplanes sp. (strain N902-109) TaxID=649831 RepID=UPI0003295D82|nr:alpha/beta fold hydrolase [Actinoplanes sp. N902-109]AGL16208.1 cysteine proteinase [Actinoplanes sp. N902-109]
MKPIRAVALVVTAGVVVTLGLLTVWPSGTLAVPDGARAGDLAMSDCDYRTEAGTVRAQCGTLVVPENRRDPAADLIALPVVRIPAAAPTPREPIFRLGGGPGSTNMTFPEASRLTAEHDVVLVGYRGVDGSRRLDCPEVTGMRQAKGDLVGAQSQQAVRLAFTACARRLTGDGVDLTGYSAAQRVDDLEAARTALGYSRINLVSSSAGTRTAMVYAWRHPASLLRSAMVSVNPPGHMVWDPSITDNQISRYAQLCAADPRCSTRTGDLAASMRDVPQRWGPFRIHEGSVRAASMFGMQNNGRASAPLNAPTVIDAHLSGPGALWAMTLLGENQLPSSIVWGEFASFAMLDAPAAADFYRAGGDPGSILRSEGTDFLWGGPDGFATVWPDSPDNAPYRTAQPSTVETLLVSGTVDFSTPAQLATDELLPLLSKGRQVILPELGHTGDFWEQADASTRLLTSFFDTGTADDSAFGTRPVDFDPGLTAMSTIATVLVALTVGGSLVALVLLAVLIRRARRGGFSPRAGMWLRIVTPLPLGLGGWFLAALLDWTLGLDAYVFGTGVVVPAVGAAVGIGAWAAWLRPGRAGRTAPAVTVGAAVAGALLGYSAGSALTAPLTAIAGAAAAANLALVILEIRQGAGDSARRSATGARHSERLAAVAPQE